MELLSTFFIGRAYAASTLNLDSFNFLSPITPGTNPVDTVNKLIGTTIGLFLTAAALAAFIYMLLAGFKYITSGGDSAKAEEARKGITNALIGIIIILVSYVVLRFVGTSLLSN